MNYHWDWLFFFQEADDGLMYYQWVLSGLGWTVAVSLTSLAIALLGTLHYRRFCGTKFGGITGDLAGWFLCRMELAMVLGLWAVGILTGIF